MKKGDFRFTCGNDKGPTGLIGKTYEEIYGSKKAKELKEIRRRSALLRRPWEYQIGQKPWNKNTRGLQVSWLKGKKMPKWYRRKLSLAKGGPSKRYRGARWLIKSHKFLQHNNICVKCGEISNISHHIIPYKLWHTNRKSNLMSLCRSCHYKIEWMYYSKFHRDCDVLRAARRLAEQGRNDLAIMIVLAVIRWSYHRLRKYTKAA